MCRIIATRLFPDGRMAQAFPITYGRARIGIGVANSMQYDGVW